MTAYCYSPDIGCDAADRLKSRARSESSPPRTLAGYAVSMSQGSNRACPTPRPFWRRLLGMLAIYALVMQPLLLTVAGSQPAQASVLDQVTYAQLCLHNADDGPVAPADQQKHPAHDHCLQCFSGAFHLLNVPQPVTVAFADREFRKLRQSEHPLRLSSSPQYSVASPRGPPLSA